MRATAEVPERADKREAILDAALDLFAQRGFHGTAVPAVAERARVGAGTIYRYFASKEALVNAVYQRHKSAVADSIIGNFPFESTAREQFHAFFARAIAFAQAEPRAFKFLELHHHAEYLDDTSKALEQRVLVFARTFLEGTREQQITKPLSSELLMSVIWGAVVGIIKASWEGRLRLTKEAAIQAENCCWEAIRA